MKRIDSVSGLRGKRVIIREDYNVPLVGKRIVSDYKLERSLKTLRFLQKQGARIIILSHLGRPLRKDPALSLDPIAKKLSTLLHEPVRLLSFFHMSNAWNELVAATHAVKPGGIIMLENIRFFKEESSNTDIFAKQLAQLGDLFVLDGFGVAHRDAASVTGVARHLPTYAGFLLDEEVAALHRVVMKPKHPVVVVLGGIKLETKLPLIKKFLHIADTILLAGGLANTCLWAQGFSVGDSYVERKFKGEMLELMRYEKICIPRDVVVGTITGKHVSTVDIEKLSSIKKGIGIYDLGPKSIKVYNTFISSAKTVIWNGAVGYFEQQPYEKGTYTLARAMARASVHGVFTVCGGGETEEVLRSVHALKKVDLVSTGGGAMMEYLSGKTLPGLSIFSR